MKATPFPRSDDTGAQLVDGIKRAVQQVTGTEATDVTFSCCEYQGAWTAFIGLPGTSVRRLQYNASPGQDVTLPIDGLRRYDDAMDALLTAQRHAATSSDPALLARQLGMRQYAVKYEKAIRLVLAKCRESHQRAAAAMLLSYSRTPARQIIPLVQAARDPNNLVRNNALRSLAIMAQANPRISRRIAAAPFIELLYSGSWQDRDKGEFLLTVLSASHDPALLRQLRTALVPLVEMAAWHVQGEPARRILGRIAGVDEEHLNLIAGDDGIRPIIDRLQHGR